MLKVDNEMLRDDVAAELADDPRVDAARIGVAADDGVVTLTGTVPSFFQKWAAEEAVKRVKGVIAVAERIEVDLPDAHRRSDTDIAHAIADAYYWDAALPDTIKATVQNGEVTLTGEAEWNAEREEAERIARRIAGVKNIRNFVALNAKVAQHDIRTQLQRMLHRIAQVDANNVEIATNGSEVTLTGNVHSWYERNEASRAAWSVKGVTAVHNRITVL